MKASWLFIFFGGGLGCVCRYYLTVWIDKQTTGNFPTGTLIVNILASFIFGLIAGYMLKNTVLEHISLLLLAGFCGGFSTFSTFSKDNYFLLEQSAYMQLFLNVALSLLLGVLFFFIGLVLTKN